MWGQCDIELELDDPNHRYQAGDEVTGRVHVEVEKDCECDQLTVSAQWFTHGRGTPTSGSDQTTLVVADEDWKPGESHTYPFRLELPNGPCTYRGHYLNVDWKVEADVDISWSFDPEVEEGIIVEPPGEPLEEPYLTGDPESGNYLDATSRAENSGTGWLVMFLVPFFAAGVGMTVLGVAGMGVDSDAIFLAGFGLVFLALPGWFMWRKVLRNRVAEMQLGDVGAGVRTTRVGPGEEVDVEVYIPPESETKINMVNVGLRGWEKVKYRQGTNTRTRTQELFSVEDVADGSISRQLADGESATFETSVEVPEEAPYSFHAYRNDIFWAATVHVDIDGWPDWKKEIPVDVVPAVESDVEDEASDEDQEAEQIGVEEVEESRESDEDFETEFETEDEDVEPVW